MCHWSPIARPVAFDDCPLFAHAARKGGAKHFDEFGSLLVGNEDRVFLVVVALVEQVEKLVVLPISFTSPRKLIENEQLGSAIALNDIALGLGRALSPARFQVVDEVLRCCEKGGTNQLAGRVTYRLNSQLRLAV